MAELYAIVQCRNSGAPPVGVEGEPVDVAAALNVMTNGFRIVFGRVFSDVWRVPGHPAAMRWLDEDVRIVAAHMAHSDATRLEGLEGDNWVLVLRLAVEGDAAGARERMTSARATRGTGTDRLIFDELMTALGDCAISRLFSQLDFAVPDTKLSAVQAAPVTATALPLLMAFYYFGLMTVHRIDRDQVRARMPIDPGGIDDASVDVIARTRVRLASVNRFFLTTNRSQYAEARDLCMTLAENMRLAERYERQVSIHHDMERHLDNITQISQVRSSRQTQAASERTNSVLYYLTVVGLPLGLFSAVMTFSLDAPLVRDADRWPTWATFLVALGASATASLILLGVMVLVASGRRRRYDAACEADRQGARGGEASD